MEQPTITLNHLEFVLDELLRAAEQLNSADEAIREEGHATLALAARLIIEHDADHFFRVRAAQRPRSPKSAREEVVEKMRRCRKNTPDKTLKEFVGDVPADYLTVEADGEYCFFKDTDGEYRVRSLDRLWADAGKPPRRR